MEGKLGASETFIYKNFQNSTNLIISSCKSQHSTWEPEFDHIWLSIHLNNTVQEAFCIPPPPSKFKQIKKKIAELFVKLKKIIDHPIPLASAIISLAALVLLIFVVGVGTAQKYCCNKSLVEIGEEETSYGDVESGMINLDSSSKM